MKITVILFLFMPAKILCQISEDFESSSPDIWLQNKHFRWDTSSSQPINGKYSLHHIYENPDSDHDQISLSYNTLLLDSATSTWRFKIRHGYSPSSNNNWGVFIVSDRNALNMYPGKDVNGYVTGVNYQGNDDLIKLWKVSSGEIYTIATTDFNWQVKAGTDKAVEFEIIRTITGTWTIKLDTSAKFKSPFIIGKAKDSEFKYSQFFGIYYKYSSSQDQKLWFDDLYINGYFHDGPADFLSYMPKPYDVLITEIMADPVPVVLLPEYEYIEIFNRSDYDISLRGWNISIGNSTISLPFSRIKTKGYIIITESPDHFISARVSNILGVDALPVLNNSGQTITLRDNKNSIIHSVNYSDKWYGTDYKAEGGWSLEMIDINNPCGSDDNWAESNDYKGGTPGQVNSVTDSNPDYINPSPKRAAITSDSVLRIYFNEPLDSLSLTDRHNYFVNHNIGFPVDIIPVIPDFNITELRFDARFKQNIIYTITIGNRIKDCAGNALKNNGKIMFAMPEKADSFDLVINEILFNPVEGGADFVEIYNRSEKVINIRYFNLAERKSFTDDFKSCFAITKDYYLLFPREYILLTASANKIIQQHYVINPDNLIELENMPSFGDNEGIITITDNQLNILDEFHYSEDLHFNLLNSCEGVSLERINSELPTNNPGNWHSASENSDFATPGYRNSQYSDFETGEKCIHVEPEIFSPDNDGYNDFVKIIYKLDNPGYIANITVFDTKGRIVIRLVNNTLLGTEGGFIWNGINEKQRKAGIGIYLIYTEIFDLNGKTYSFKNTCVLASKIN
ncbi:MAG: lamin tail domain-containing protein [Bacteroidales bacterium]|nr:MAG: lamin tail domain-containing protein [Bacteroidales bacterium]